MAGVKGAIRLSYEESHKTIDGVIFKMCSICKSWLTESNSFYKNKLKNNNFRYHSYCKSCEINKSIKRNKLHYDDMLASQIKYNQTPKRKLEMRKRSDKQRKDGGQKIWQQNNPDKCNEYGRNKRQNQTHNISKPEWEYCKEYFNYECAYCGLPLEDHYRIYAGKQQKVDFHKEHVVHDGSNALDNCVPSCGSCNSKKWKLIFEEWYDENNPLYSKERYNKIINWLKEQ